MADVADALFHGAVLGEVGADVDECESLDARCLRHSRRAERAALAGGFAVGVHDFLIVPAHAEHEVGVLRELGYGVAGLGIAGEDDAAGGGVEAVCEGVEEGLDVLCGGGGYLPVGAGEYSAGADVGSGYVGRPAGRVPPRFWWMRWLRGWPTRAFQSCAKTPSFSSRMPRVMRSVRVGPKTWRSFSLPVLWSHRHRRKQG